MLRSVFGGAKSQVPGGTTRNSKGAGADGSHLTGLDLVITGPSAIVHELARVSARKWKHPGPNCSSKTRPESRGAPPGNLLESHSPPRKLHVFKLGADRNEWIAAEYSSRESRSLARGRIRKIRYPPIAIRCFVAVYITALLEGFFAQ